MDKVRDALDTCSFLKTVNHDIPIFFLDEMLQGDRKIYKKDINFNKQYYIRDIVKKKIVHARNFYLYSPSIHATNWRDYIFFKMEPKPPSQEEYQ